MTRSTLTGIFRCEEGIKLTRPGTVRGDTLGLRAPTKNNETTTTVWVRVDGGSEGWEVLWETVQDRQRIDPGGTIISYSF